MYGAKTSVIMPQSFNRAEKYTLEPERDLKAKSGPKLEVKSKS